MTTPLPFEQQYPTIAPLLVALAEWYRMWRSSPHVTDLANHSPDDVERIAHDVGLTATELRKLERNGADPLLLPRMLAALKIDAAALAHSEPAAYRDLQRVCALCDSKRRCASELAAGDAPKTFESYCPNALTLKAIA
jgi:hypothetical protein